MPWETIPPRTVLTNVTSLAQGAILNYSVTVKNTTLSWRWKDLEQKRSVPVVFQMTSRRRPVGRSFSLKTIIILKYYLRIVCGLRWRHTPRIRQNLRTGSRPLSDEKPPHSGRKGDINVY